MRESLQINTIHPRVLFSEGNVFKSNNLKCIGASVIYHQDKQTPILRSLSTTRLTQISVADLDFLGVQTSEGEALTY